VPVTDRERSPRRISFVWLCEEDMEMWKGRQRDVAKRRKDYIQA